MLNVINACENEPSKNMKTPKRSKSLAIKGNNDEVSEAVD